MWVAGLFGLLLGSSRRFRILGWIYVVLLATMVALHAKNYYLAPIYPVPCCQGFDLDGDGDVDNDDYAAAVTLMMPQ